MISHSWIPNVGLWRCALLILFSGKFAWSSSASPPEIQRDFAAHGVILDVQPAARIVVIRHEAIAGFMSAMTMPFTVKDTNILAGLLRGEVVGFQLHVAEAESWVDQFSRTGVASLPVETNSAPSTDWRQELLHYPFTNELGQAVSLSDFPGQALAITFFYTRCPLPEFCPRLSRNFQAASRKLTAMPGAPANWHFLSVSFDPEFDSPALLRAYGENYRYDPAHWSFLTGPADRIHQLAQAAGVTISTDGSVLNHNFRTLIIDASGHLQTVFPTSGDLSDQIVSELLKAARATKSGLTASAPPEVSAVKRTP